MTLLASFTQPVADAQSAFRRILKAMSEPGVVVTLPSIPAWGTLSPAATALLMTLADGETPVWLDPILRQTTLINNLRFHTGASLAAEPGAPFAVLTQGSAWDATLFNPGDDLSPETSTTVIVEVGALNGGLTLRLRGPGILESRAVAPKLPPDLLHWLRERPHRFPQGVDLIFTAGSQLMALPRTIDVEVC